MIGLNIQATSIQIPNLAGFVHANSCACAAEIGFAFAAERSMHLLNITSG